MTEADWLAEGADRRAMLRCVSRKSKNGLSMRKTRLLVANCFRRVWHLLDEKTRTTEEASERYADGFMSLEEYDNVSYDLGAGIDERDSHGILADLDVAAETVVGDDYKPWFARKRVAGTMRYHS